MKQDKLAYYCPPDKGTLPASVEFGPVIGGGGAKLGAGNNKSTDAALAAFIQLSHQDFGIEVSIREEFLRQLLEQTH